MKFHNTLLLTLAQLGLFLTLWGCSESPVPKTTRELVPKPYNESQPGAKSSTDREKSNDLEDSKDKRPDEDQEVTLLKSMCSDTNSVWGLKSNQTTNWYAYKKKIIPIEGLVNTSGYILTNETPSFDDFQINLEFNIDTLDTYNKLRDDRIKNLFFLNNLKSTFSLTEIKIDQGSADLPAAGNSSKIKFIGDLSIVGIEIQVEIDAYVTATNSTIRIVNGDTKTSINARSTNTLSNGVDDLLEVANLGPDDMEDLVNIVFDYEFINVCK